jgi:ABC-type Zn uptake system ZnuABC Zn-binding protein ZnuA
MLKKHLILSILFFCLLLFFTGCSKTSNQNSEKMKVVAVENYLADIVKNIAGDRMEVDSLFPIGVDPHSFEPSVQDVLKISKSSAIVINGGGLEPWIDKVLTSVAEKQPMIVASQGLQTRQEASDEESHDNQTEHTHEAGDPHFWLDPVLVIQYAKNIRDGLSALDPEGASIYAQNADSYINKLEDLDKEIRKAVSEIPAEQRLIITNHESFGYFADEYGFKIVGTVLMSSSSMSDPSAGQLTTLINRIKETGTRALFLETGSNTALAEQIAKETGIKLITDLYTHSLTPSDGGAPTYLEMIRHNVNTIVEALK